MQQVAGMWLPRGDVFFTHCGDYEAYEYAQLIPYVDNLSIAIDIGAHVGFWSKRLVQDFIKVHAFEAMPAHADCLALNVPTTKLQIHRTALSNHTGTVPFAAHIENSGMSGVREGGNEIACTTLDSYGFTNVGLIKIDVEGHELEVLQGAVQTIANSKPVLYVEILKTVDTVRRNQLWDFIHSLGYTLQTVVGDPAYTTTPENYIFKIV